ncbi:hypothetical protein H072_124 [Dactylellina haptotyla CBS 200.50]|uniref:Uncharacterized protein n=1 Tax=Dactylellina haptotyla (strain CBS 200.50) TaxID=1284197 RepID=S8C2J0_DACHA|nr:hypothetical protein H072_124 [Dactylellina haptotyla CBS 200.50]
MANIPFPVLSLLLLLSAPSIASLFSSKKPPPPPPRNLFSKVFPIVVAFTILTVIGVVLYLTYKTVLSVSSDVYSRLDHGGVKLSKTGADVELKGLSYEKYRDATQKIVVSAWNNAETKDYKSRLFSSKDKKSHGLKQRDS